MYPQPQDPWNGEDTQPSPSESAAQEPATEPVPTGGGSPGPPAGRGARWREKWNSIPLWGRLLSLGGAVTLLCCCGLAALALVVSSPTDAPSPVGESPPAAPPPTVSSPEEPSGSPREAESPRSSPSLVAPPVAPPAEPTQEPAEPVEPPEPPEPTPAPPAEPADEVQTRTETETIPYQTERVDDPDLPEGTEEVRRIGRDGEKTLTYEVTLANGLETGRKLVDEEVTREPVNEVIAVGTMAQPESVPEPQTSSESDCDPNYAGACVPIAEDVDCEGGTGDGPEYVRGPVWVVGEDIYGLDADKNGIGCED